MRFSVKRQRFQKLKFALKLMIPILIIAVLFILIIKRLEPLFWKRVEAYAVIKTETAVNNAVTDILVSENIKYTDLVNLRTYPDGGISALEIDNVKVNVLKAALSKEIMNSILNSENGYISINLGTISGSPLFSGLGPRIRIKISPSNQTIIEFKDKLTESGINQVKHAVYLDVSVNVTLTTALSQKSTNFKTTIPIADTVIVGTVPQYYGTAGMSFIGD